MRNGDLDAELERLLDDDPIPDRVPGWADHSAPSPTYGTCQPSGFLALELYTGTTDTDAELDHVVAWADGGGTSEANLRAYCLHHHRLKHHAGWHVDAHPDGRLTWTTPTGHRHITENHDYRPEPPPPPPTADPAHPDASTDPDPDPDPPPF